MTRSRLWAAALVTLIAVLAAVHLRASDADKPVTAEKSATTNSVVFQGKVVAVVTSAEPLDFLPLTEVRTELLGDRTFLVGRCAASIGGGIKGTTVWVSLKDVRRLLEFDNLDAIKQVVRIPAE